MRKLLSVLSSTLQGGVRGGLLLLLLVASVSAIYASDIKVGGIWYDFDSSTKTASVTYRGYSPSFYDGEYSGSVIIPETVTYNGTTYSVTSIGEGAFRDCSSLTSITIPESVTSIGVKAFSGCSSLTKTNYTGDIAGWCNIEFVNYAANPMYYSHNFYINDQEIKDLVIPNNVTSIGSYAFNGCSSLTSVTIPNSVTSIGEMAFYGCSSLTSVTINSDAIVNKAYSSNSNFSQIFGSQITEYIIGESVTSIGGWAFAGCSSLTSVTIPESVTSIGDYAFYDCSSLTSVTIPNSVTSIGKYAFQDCSSLTSVTIPNSVTSIGNYAFDRCSALTSVTIPNSVTSIGQCAFGRCSSLTSVTIPESVTSIGYAAFEYCYSLTKTNYTGDIAGWCNIKFGGYSANPMSYSHNFYINDQEIKDLVIPNSVTSIGDNAFDECSSLTSVTIPNSVTSIGKYAFYGCSSLTSITIPNSVTSIGGWAFDGCSSLNEVILGTGLKTIDEYAFQGSTKLYDVYCYAAEPPTTSESSFENYNAFLHVPCESQRLYLLDINFGNFKYIECVSSDEVSTDGVVVTPSTNDVTIIWPTETGADSYTIVIKKGDTVFCTLTFNADGQLLNIAFAPGRNGNHPAQYAEQAGNGYRFTVTGLESGTKYGYNIDVKDASNKTIKSHSGEFTTQSTTAVENTHSQSPTSNCQKLLHDNQLLILRDDKTYNIVGQIVE